MNILLLITTVAISTLCILGLVVSWAGYYYMLDTQTQLGFRAGILFISTIVITTSIIYYAITLQLN